MPIGIGVAILGAGVLGAGASIFGAGEQVSAEQAAIQAQEAMYAQGLKVQGKDLSTANSTLSPFIAGGQNSQDWYNYLTGVSGSPAGSTATTSVGPNGQPTTVGGSASFNPLTAPLTAPFTAANLPSTPGYQFTLDQGLKSTQNSYAAQGLGSSGVAEKGAASYSTGLAQNTYNQQFANYLTQNQQIANMLLGGAQVGAGAAGTLAGIYGNAGNAALGGAVNTGQGVASSEAGIGNAYAGGAAGVANSATSGVNSLMQYNLYNQLLTNQQQALAISPNALAYNQNALASSGSLGGGGNLLTYGVPGVGSTGGYNAFGG